MSQNDRIVEYCKIHKSITGADAWYRLGIASLSRRICDLRDRGYSITKITETGICAKTGEPTHWTRYFVKEKKHV